MQISRKDTSLPKKEFPAELGYRMPAEWAAHEAVWLAWPHNAETWPGKKLTAVRDTYLQMLEGLLPGEKVHLLVKDVREKDEVRKFLQPKLDLKNLIFHEVPAADTWIRDYGPTFLTKSIVHSPENIAKAKNKPIAYGLSSMDYGLSTMNSKKAYVKWIFNAWGGKYASLMEDTHLFKPENGLVSQPCFDAGFILEGGSIEVNGSGTVLTTEQCLLNTNRNPQFSREKIEDLLKKYLGVSCVLWLDEGIAGDDTDGHIDDIARFTDSRTILAAYEDDKSDENFRILNENWERLKTFELPDGKKPALVKLPMPGIVTDGDVRLPASYANFLIANKAVLLPIYGHKNDSRAVKIVQELFPKHEVLPIRCNDLVYGLGAIHCVSQQEPA